METFDQLWQRLEASVPDVTGEPLAPGASLEAVTQVEQVLGVHLPDDVTASYRRHNGNFPMQLPIQMTVLPLDDIVSWWQTLEELRHDESWANQPPLYFTKEALRSGRPSSAPIQPVWWHQCWVPIAADLGGNLSCVDLVPAPGGLVGQIIDWDHECGPTSVLFSSFTHLLTALADEMEARLDP